MFLQVYSLRKYKCHTNDDNDFFDFINKFRAVLEPKFVKLKN